MFSQVFLSPRLRRTHLPVLPPLIVTLFVAVLSPVCLFAQVRGMRGPVGSVRTAPSIGTRRLPPTAHGPGSVRVRSSGRGVSIRHFPSRHHFRFNALTNACLTDPFLDPFFCRRFFFNNPFPFSGPILLPYPVYTESSYGPVDESISTRQDEASELNSKIDRLADEVERLRHQTSEKPQPASVEYPVADAHIPTRILVFRNGQRTEIQNYAMVGDTLWILSEQHARKISVSDLDVESTKKENAERGLEFP